MITITTFIIILLSCVPSGIVYWIKWCIAYLAIRYHKSKHRRRFDVYKPNAVGDPEKLGFLTPQIEKQLESPQLERHLQNSADEVLFYGVNSMAECVLIRLSRQRNYLADAWIYLRMSDGTTYQLIEPVNYQHSEDEESLMFTCGSLQMQSMFPMRRWRIEYCGSLLRKYEDDEHSQEEVFVKFVFLWCASSDVYDVFESKLQIDTKESARSLAMMEWKSMYPPLQKFLNASNSYIQVGNLRGRVTVEDQLDHEMFLFGDKQRNLGNRDVTADVGYPLIMGYVPQNGLGFHLQNNTKKDPLEVEYGFVISPDGSINSYKEVLIPFHQVTENLLSGSFYTVNGVNYELHCQQVKDSVTLKSKDGISKISFVEFSFMNKTGYGFYLNSRDISNESVVDDVPVIRTVRPESVPLVVQITDKISQFGGISGGKGSSLGKLTELSYKNKTFTVPKGIIATTSAYDMFLNSSISSAIKELENATFRNSERDKKELCRESVIKAILESPLPDRICDNIIKKLSTVFGEEFETLKFAVRSSATGEDTDVMSAAGQMDTFLAVQGLKNIFDAVRKCWASQFSLTALEYKRQYGQLLNSPMAVVIQEMVACQVSGVMFTCDPVTNNPNCVTITANYGLGETVVSGSVEPDTLVLTKKGAAVKELIIGSKLQKEVMKESGGTRLEEISEDQKSVSCLNNEMAEKLAKLAIEVEKFYRSPRDIEWGIEQNSVYLLQARPVTSGSLLTDFELKHEFNTVLRCERDYFTLANVGEVLPGATPPLPAEMCSKLFAKAMQKWAFDKGISEIMAKRVYCPSDMFYQQIVMSVPELTFRHGHDTMLSKGFLISIFGRVLEEAEIYEIAKERFPHSMKPPLLVQLLIYKEMMTYENASKLDALRKKVDSYDLPFMNHKTSEETFDALMKSCSDFLDPAVRHIVCSGFSSHWNSILFAILAKAKRGIDADVYSDFGKILATTSGVESAEVPSLMQELANQIVKDVDATTFKNMSLEDAERWLNNSNTLSKKLYQEFISRHGHRCLKEFDLHMLTWEEDQRSLIKLLQASVGNTQESRKRSNKSYSELFSELITPLTFWERLLLRFVIPNSRKGVRCRETTKSIIIKCMDYWRKGFRRLGQQMASEGRIPDENLLYFITLDEIKSLLETRDPKIIIRANQRRKIFPTLQKYKLPEIIRGYPKPGDEVSTEDSSYESDLTMKGVPVSQGVVKGYARVATSLEEAASIKSGEILIAFSTDIGWSPYFPIISGVATELGGMISHGAVVSREYGLPCVVGVQGATKMFKTGDYMLLDGRKGILQRLSKPESLDEKESNN